MRGGPIRLDLFVRDACCAAGDRLVNLQPWYLDHPNAASDDLSQVAALIEQAQNALEEAVTDGDMTQEDADTLENLLLQSAGNLTPADFSHAAADLATACAMFD